MGSSEQTCCPYVDLGHPACGDRFRLDSLADVLDYCFSDGHRCCESHAVIQRGAKGGVPMPQPIIITVSCHDRSEQLRPTGS